MPVSCRCAAAAPGAATITAKCLVHDLILRSPIPGTQIVDARARAADRSAEQLAGIISPPAINFFAGIAVFEEILRRSEDLPSCHGR